MPAVRACAALLAAAGLAAVLPAAAAAAVAPSDGCASVPRRQAESLEADCYAVMHGGRERYLRVYAPKGRAGPLPLVFVLHGGGGSAGNMEWLTANGFDRIADREGLLVVYPEGIGNSWNDGRSDLRAEATRQGIDDVGFLRALPAAIAGTFPVDTDRVYATGISNGGLMSFRLACDAADVFAAVAPVTANLSAELAPACAPARPISIAIFNGTEDPLVPYAGGQIRVLFARRGEVLSTAATLERWRGLNACAPLVAGPIADADADDDTRLRIHRADCARGGELALYEFIGGGHTWPGGVQYLPALLVGRTSRELDASAAIWGFLQRFRLGADTAAAR